MIDSKELDDILNPDNHKWVGVKTFQEIREDTAFGNYKRLTAHHKEETEALVAKCRGLAEEVKRLRQVWLPCDQTAQCAVCGHIEGFGEPERHSDECPIGYLVNARQALEAQLAKEHEAMTVLLVQFRASAEAEKVRLDAERKAQAIPTPPVRYDGTGLPRVAGQRTYQPDDRIYYWGWTGNGGHVEFGMHGTKAEWDRKLANLLADIDQGSYITLTKCRLVCTGKEQNDYLEKRARVAAGWI